jgi:prepilin-type N-terminal cleavage/methylation domain-containing protein
MRQRGFTLIEILVTLVVVAIGVSLIGINVAGSRRAMQLETTVSGFYQRLSLAQEEAILMNRQMGFRLRETGEGDTQVLWMAQLFDDAGRWYWGQAPGEVFKTVAEPLLAGVVLEVEGIDVDLLEEAEPRDPEIYDGSKPSLARGVLPQVFILASGEMTPFSWQLAPEDALDDVETHRIQANVIGQMRWLKPGDDGRDWDE